LHRLHVGPAEQPPAVEHERLDTEAATGQFDRAILADQALLVAAIDPDDGPVRLLAAEAPRQPATWQFPGQRLDEVVGMRGEIERLYLGFGQCVAANLQPQRDAPCLRLRQGEPVPVAASLFDRAQGSPLAIAPFQLDHIALRALAGICPAQDQATELALLAQVQYHPLPSAG